MIKVWHDKAWDDYLCWQSKDKQILRRINLLVKDMERNPFDGIGKPEPLKGGLSGYWSRRIDSEHRIIYKVKDNQLHIIQCRNHYNDK